MAQFKFQLASVLRHREIIEQQKQRDHALVLARLKEFEDQIKALNQTMQETNDDVRQNRLTGTLDINFITAHRRFLFGMQRKAMDLVTQMAKVQREADVTRLALAHAAKERKILEKLRETQEGRWKEEQSRKELAAADEVSMQLFNDSPL